MRNFAKTKWNSTCNPCFSTFDQFFFVFHGLKTFFFCYSLKLNFICYLNRFFTFDYSLWDEGRHTFLRAKTNFNFKLFFICVFVMKVDKPQQFYHSYVRLQTSRHRNDYESKWKCRSFYYKGWQNMKDCC